MDLRWLFIALFIMSCGLLCIAIVWFYRKFISVYSQFPSYMVDFRILYWYLKKKKGLPMASYAVEILLKELDKHYTEGIVVLWIVYAQVVVLDEKLIKKLVNEPAAIDKPEYYKVVKDLIGDGIFSSNGEKWRKRRKMFNPIFHMHNLKDKIPIFNEHADILVEELEKIEDKSSIVILNYVKPCMLKSLCDSILGIKANNENLNADVNQFTKSVEKMMQLSVDRICYPWLYFIFTLKLFPSARKTLNYLQNSDNLPRKILSEIKKSIISHKIHGNDLKEDNGLRKLRTSFAYKLVEIQMHDPTFTEKDAIDEIKIFMAAGYDTVSQSLNFTLYLLGLHPDVQEQCFNEIQFVSGHDLTYADLEKLTYLECVIKESLRLYPVGPAFYRIIRKEVTFGKYVIPRDTRIIVSPYIHHRNPYIYREPEKFDPDRFNGDDKSLLHIGFAEGIRSCIGKRFALLEMKIILAHILRKFKITSLDSRENMDVNISIVLNSVRPLHMKLELRNP